MIFFDSLGNEIKEGEAIKSHLTLYSPALKGLLWGKLIFCGLQSRTLEAALGGFISCKIIKLYANVILAEKKKTRPDTRAKTVRRALLIYSYP